MTVGEGAHRSAQQAELCDKARELIAEAIQLLDGARQPVAAAYLAQAMETVKTAD